MNPMLRYGIAEYSPDYFRLYVAYSAGANNAANAVGLLWGSIIGSIPGPFLGSCHRSRCTSHGREVLDTVGKEITELV